MATVTPGGGWSGSTAQPATIGLATAVSSINTATDLFTTADSLAALPTVFAVKIESPKTFTVTPSGTINAGRTFALRVRSNPYDYAFAEVSYTTVDGDGVGQVVDGLVAAWNGHADPRVNTHTAVDAGTSLTVTTNAEVFAGYIQPWPPSQSGSSDNVLLTVSEDPPAPLNPRQRYWARKFSSTTVKLYTAEASATADTSAIDLTDGGTGPHRLVQYGMDCKPNARWNCVPYQVFDTTFNVGVVADHQAGIDRVEFAVNEGDWVVAAEATNPRTSSTEYFVTLDASDFAPGGDTAKVRAVIYPMVGIPRVLDGDIETDRGYGSAHWQGEWELELYPNKSETVVELAAGTHNWGQGPLNATQSAGSTWFVVKPATGVARTDVIVKDAGSVGTGFALQRVRLEGVTCHLPCVRSFTAGTQHLWRHDCYVTDPLGRYNPAGSEESVGNYWQTATTVTNVRIGTGRGYIHGSHYSVIGEDCCRGLDMIVDSTIDDVDAGATDWHPAPIPNPLGKDNRIYQNLVITNTPGACYAFRQGNITDYRHTDVMIRDGSTQKTSSGNIMLYIGGTVHNLLVRDHAFVSGSVSYRGSSVAGYWTFNGDNVLYDQNTFGGGSPPYPKAGTTINGLVSSGYEDWTTWTKVDPNNKFAVFEANQIVSVPSTSGIDRNEDIYVSKDFGAGYFDRSFTHHVDARFESSQDASECYYWMLTNTPVAAFDISDFWAVRARLVSGNAQFEIVEKVAGTASLTNTSPLTLAEGTTHYLEIEYAKSTGTHGTLYLRAYSDAGWTTEIASASRALTASATWRYAQTATGFGNNALSSRVARVTVSNMVLTMPDPLAIGVEAHADPEVITVAGPCQLSVEAVGGVEPYTYQWTVETAPIGGGAVFSPDETERTPTVTVDAPGNWVFEVVVTDADLNSVTSVVPVTARLPEAINEVASGGVAVLGAADQGVIGASLVLSGGISAAGTARDTTGPRGFSLPPIVKVRVNLRSVQNNVIIGPGTNERITGCPVLLDLTNLQEISIPSVGQRLRHGDEFHLQGEVAARTVENHTNGVEGDYTSTPLVLVKRY